jgi:hypothetical protein
MTGCGAGAEATGVRAEAERTASPTVEVPDWRTISAAVRSRGAATMVSLRGAVSEGAPPNGLRAYRGGCYAPTGDASG